MTNLTPKVKQHFVIWSLQKSSSVLKIHQASHDAVTKYFSAITYSTFIINVDVFYSIE